MERAYQLPAAARAGRDIDVHSTTKFLDGHSDSAGGVAVAKDKGHAQWLQFLREQKKVRKV